MYDFLELIHTLLTEGITWATAISIILAILKWRESRVKQRRNEDLHRKVDMLLRKEGIAWTAPNTLAAALEEPAKKRFAFWPLPLMGATIARYAGAFTNWRLRRMIDKKWLVALLVTIAGIVKEKTGYAIPIELLNNVSDWVWLGGIIGVALWNMFKKNGGNAVAGNYDLTGLDSHAKDA